MQPGDAGGLDIVLLDRNECRQNGAQCHRGRNVRKQQDITNALQQRFGATRSVRTLKGDESLKLQALAFNRAEVVVGPHGGSFANIIFCATGAIVVEYIALQRENSALYMAYAHAFGLKYWVVASNASACRLSMSMSDLTRATVCTGVYDSIEPLDVVETVEAALQEGAVPSTLRAEEEAFLVRGYGEYHRGWPTGW